jgi:hypothetical protein
MTTSVRPRSAARSATPFVALALAACHPGAAAAPRAPSRVGQLPVPTLQVGACAEPTRDGVVGTAPAVTRADRDLDGDGQAEVVTRDRALCTPDGNCYWNVFVRDPAGGCPRYAGTLAGAALEPLETRGDERMADVRAYWSLGAGNRFLVEDYRFVRGGYQSAGTLLCRRLADDRLQCSEDAGTIGSGSP